MEDRGQDWATSMLKKYRGAEEDRLEKITRWASRGTLAQFQVEIEAKLAGTEYSVKREGNILRVYRMRKVGGFLGIGAKTIKQPVMAITRGEAGAEIAPEPLDPAFVEYLSGLLRPH